MRKFEGLSKDQRLARAKQAEALLSDELLNDVLERIETQWLEAISNSAPSDVDKREMAYTMLYGAKRFRAELRAIANDFVMTMKPEVNDG